MQEIKSFPIFYPPDGLYYIFSKEYGQFWRQRGAVDGGMIDCIPLGHAKEGVSLDNRIVSQLLINYFISWNLMDTF